MKNIFFTDESVKRQITDSISENLTDSDLESEFVLLNFEDVIAEIIKISMLSQILNNYQNN